MNAPVIPFYAGFLSVVALFLSSLVLGVFIRAVYLAFKRSVPLPKKARRKRKAKTPSAVHSIEIDPEQIDRIYVKKVS
ncbi:MAG: hypothetical protein J5697_02285 [Clostridia bacterium]|nr:hypothetical protein [Clostridia bacterium]